ncbi:hypothetical protein VaNZ11_007370 [Volvox africanus]|uniref:SRCR domain-containing protein n=1 Tax=Volvox africanus TaxID=51714 RepID=A0ABQ5S3J7_9CHLO|nr:hypothetical protein VaNZ11_007370 [Volvox africanus]
MVTPRGAFAGTTLVLVLTLLKATTAQFLFSPPDSSSDDLSPLSPRFSPPDYESPPPDDGPPPEYEPRDAPPPPLLLRVRLVDSAGNPSDGLSGIMQLSSFHLSAWGAFCVNAHAIQKNANKYDVMAKLVCRQLGMPQRYASLVPSSKLNLGSLPPMPSVALVATPSAPCDNYWGALSVTDCEGVMLQPTQLPCSSLQLEEGEDLEPAAVICAGAMPPSPPSPPPRAPPLHLTTRIIDAKTGQALPGLTSGRLQVLLPVFDEWGDEVWGTVCRADRELSTALAQYACLQAGHAGWEAASFFTPSTRYPMPSSVPTALVAARKCSVVGSGAQLSLDCAILVGERINAELLLSGSGLDEQTRWELIALLDTCDPLTDQHQLDAFVECPVLEPPNTPYPSLPPSPPQVIYNHSVGLLGREVLPDIYDIIFGVLRGESVVTGTVCSRRDDANGYFSYPTKNTLCNLITSGKRPYGSIAPASLDIDFPFLDSPEYRRTRPVLLDTFECEDGVGDDTSAPLSDLNYCKVRFARPGQSLYRKCWNSGWASSLLVCSDKAYNMDPEVVGIRLAGGPSPSFGRVEVLLRNDLQYGWGTVCDDGSFTATYAQAVCRDLGLEWVGAEVYSSSVLPASESEMPVLMTDIRCDINVFQYGEEEEDHPPLSFVRDCTRDPDFLLQDCPADQHVVVHCRGDGDSGMPLAPPPYPPSPPPPYGGYYGSLPQPPPYYPHLPPPPAPPAPPSPCRGHYGGYYGGYYDGYGCYGGYGGGGGDGGY